MPETTTLARARRDKREGKSASTQAGEFVREAIEHVRRGKHGARSPQQAIAIGLSKARRAGVKLKPPAKGKSKPRRRRQAVRELERGAQARPRAASRRRSRATSGALQREGAKAANHGALSRPVKPAAARRRRAPAKQAA